MSSVHSEIYQYYPAAPAWKRYAGIDTGNIKVLIFVITLSLLYSLVLVLSDGNLFAALAFFGGVLVVSVTLYRVQWGFFLLVGLVLSFDQFYIPRFHPWTLKISYFLNVKEIPYVPYVDAAVMNPMELHILLVVLMWFIVICFKRDFRCYSIPIWAPAISFFSGVIAALFHGLYTGGDFLVALWEVRALFYCAMMFFLVPQIIQSKEDLRALMWVFIISISFKAFQGIERFIRLGFNFRGIATLTNHEDPLFMLTLIIFLMALVLYNVNDRQRTALMLLLFPLLMGFFVAQRRAAYGAIATSIVVFIAVLGNKERWALVKVMLPALVIITIYSMVFWESESRLGSPVRLIKTAVSSDKEIQGERYYSNLYREIEKFDLAVTVKAVPVAGIGFGNTYLQPIKLARMPVFPLRDYIPHNAILWLVVKMGAVGFFLFWFFISSFGCYAANVHSKLRDPYLKSVCCVAIVAVVGQITVSYYDLQLTYYRNMVHLGTLMGVVATLESLQSKLSEKESGKGLAT